MDTFRHTCRWAVQKQYQWQNCSSPRLTWLKWYPNVKFQSNFEETEGNANAMGKNKQENTPKSLFQLLSSHTKNYSINWKLSGLQGLNQICNSVKTKSKSVQYFCRHPPISAGRLPAGRVQMLTGKPWSISEKKCYALQM